MALFLIFWRLLLGKVWGSLQHLKCSPPSPFGMYVLFYGICFFQFQHPQNIFCLLETPEIIFEVHCLKLTLELKIVGWKIALKGGIYITSKRYSTDHVFITKQKAPLHYKPHRHQSRVSIVRSTFSVRWQVGRKYVLYRCSRWRAASAQDAPPGCVIWIASRGSHCTIWWSPSWKTTTPNLRVSVFCSWKKADAGERIT